MRATEPGGWLRALLVVGLVLAVLAQLKILYTPTVGGVPPFPHADKVVHAAVFALPVICAALSGGWLTSAALVGLVHAPVSELVQHAWVPGRTGDPWDVVADVVGVGLAVLVVLVVRRLGARRRAPLPMSADASS